MECPICIKNYTKVNRGKIKCSYCENTACIQCFITHTSLNILNPTCIFCEKTLPLKFFKQYVSQWKYKTLLKKELKANFQKEQSLIFQTRRIIEEEKLTFHIEKLKFHLKQNGFNENEIFSILKNSGYTTTYNTLNILAFFICKKCTFSLNKSQRINNALICINCKTTICYQCLEIQNNNHVCNEQNISSVNLLKQQCNKCPFCNIYIEKENGGCDQMFCTFCKTTFSWRTGRIVEHDETKHNPHYYEWKRQNGNIERSQLDHENEGKFLLFCENELHDQKMILPHLFNQIGLPKNIEIDKGAFLLEFQHMFMTILLNIFKVQEQESNFRYYYRTQFCKHQITFNQWKNKVYSHFKALKQNENIKTVALATLNNLYSIVLFENADSAKIEKLCINSALKMDEVWMNIT